MHSRWWMLLVSIAAPVMASAACGHDASTAPTNDGGYLSDAAMVDAISTTDARAPLDGSFAPESSLTDAPLEAGATRPYRLTSGGVQLLVTGPNIGLQMTAANLATDVDLFDVHQEYYGVPWDEFSTGQAPPAAWVSTMDGIAQSAKAAGKPVFLSVSMLDGARQTLAPKAIVQNGMLTTQDWPTSCFDLATDPQGPTIQAAYLAYVAWMIAEFSPQYLNIAIEVNLFFEHCPSAMAGVVTVANAAYKAAKKGNANLVVFPSIQIEHLYGYSGNCTDGSCYDANYAQLAPLLRDRFAMSSYPALPGVFDTPQQLPSDWLTRGAMRGNERAVIAETGWNSTPLVAQTSAGVCDTVDTSTEADTAAYLTFVLKSAQTMPMDLVDWWADRDLVVTQLMTNCPCTFDTTWCEVLTAFSGSPVLDGGTDTYFFGQLELKAFAAMGLRDYTGNPKATTFPIWQSALELPVAP